MNVPGRLRFKVLTSFVIAALGVTMAIRLASTVPLSGATVIWFLVPVLFVVAGVWRGFIFLKAVRGGAKS